jgi:hypothetical protein
MGKMGIVSTAFILMTTTLVAAKEIQTNNIYMQDAPSWLSESRVEKATQPIQSFLEWDIRRIKVFFYSDDESFKKIHHLNVAINAFSRKSDNTVHLGPKVNDKSFDGIFGHELVHIVLYQKYKDAIPAWLEEGLANYVGKKEKVNYQWLAAQPLKDVTHLTHVMQSQDEAAYHYSASTAAMEMIAAKCSLSDLLQLSVGKKLETYLTNYCNIPDVNSEFAKWVKEKGTKPAPLGSKS